MMKSIFSAAILYVGLMSQAFALPENFVKVEILTNLDQPVNMVSFPSGDTRMFVLEKSGDVLLFDTAVVPATYTAVLSLQNILTSGERGLASAALDPQFGSNGYLYLYYTAGGAGARNRISRFTFDGGAIAPGSELIVWEESDPVSGCCHFGGGLDFGPDNYLYLTTGDAFDGLQAQDLTKSGGKIIRVDTGNLDSQGGWVRGGANSHIIPPDNPSFIADGPGGNLDEIWAYGLRNPYRAHWDLVEGVFYIGEVGGNVQSTATEDIHVGRKGANFGWPYCEGYCDEEIYDDPIYVELHEGGNSAISAGVVYRGGVYPAAYDDVFFFGNYVRGDIKYLVLDNDGAVSSTQTFDADGGSIVALEVGSDGLLYVMDYVQNRLLRYEYDSGNRRPEITSASATPLSGDAPLAVTFAASASDVEDDELTYQWFFGDGTDQIGANVQHTYSTSGEYLAFVSVFDGNQISFSRDLRIAVGTEPVVTIDAPADGALFEAGDTIPFSGSVIGDMGGDYAYGWEVEFLHDGHVHPTLSVDGPTGSLGVESSGHDYTGATGYILTLTAESPSGLRGSSSVTVYPDKVDLSISTVPSGLDVFVDGTPRTAPFALDTVIGFEHVVSVEESVCLENVEYAFDNWSSGASRSHVRQVGSSDASLVARFVAGGSCGDVPQQALAGWYETDAGVIMSGPTLLAWQDQSGNGNHLDVVQGNPALVQGAANGQAVIDLDGSLDSLGRYNAISGLPSGNQDRTVFAVADFRDTSTGIGGISFGAGNNNETFGLVIDRNGGAAVQGWGSGNDFFSGVPVVDGGFMVHSVVLESGDVDQYVDGVIVQSFAHDYQTNVERMVFGAEIDEFPAMDMQLAAVLIYDRALGAAERQQVESYLQGKYVDSGGGNRSPVAADDTGTVGNGDVAVLEVLSNDTDDGTLDVGSVTIVGAAQFGTVTVNTDGTVSYAHDGVSAGTADGFGYTVADDQGAVSNVAQVQLTITGTGGGGGGGGGEVPQAGLVAYFEADAGVSADGAGVLSGWADQSGAGNDLVAGGDPRRIEGALNGHPVIDFDGEGDLLERTSGLGTLPSGASDRTAYAVVNYRSGGWGGVSWGAAQVNATFGLAVSRERRPGRGGDFSIQGWGVGVDNPSPVRAIGAGWVVQSVVLENDALEHALDGAVIDTGTRAYGTDPQRLILGAEIDGAPAVDMQLAAVLIYDRALSAAERQQVESYLQGKYFGSGGGNP